MSRVYNSQTMVSLPKMTGTQTSMLMRQLMTRGHETLAANRYALPPDILRSFDRMARAHEALVQAKLPMVVPDSITYEVDQAVDNAWRVLHGWLLAWTQIPEGSHRQWARAKALYELLFGSVGMKFINEAFVVEWQESQYRLDAMIRDGYESTLEELGGRAILDQLLLAQKKYGDVLGITSLTGPAPETGYKEELEAAGYSIREYVGRVALFVDPDLDGSEQIARILLEPIESWESKKADDKAATSSNGAATSSNGAATTESSASTGTTTSASGSAGD